MMRCRRRRSPSRIPTCAISPLRCEAFAAACCGLTSVPIENRMFSLQSSGLEPILVFYMAHIAVAYLCLLDTPRLSHFLAVTSLILSLPGVPAATHHGEHQGDQGLRGGQQAQDPRRGLRRQGQHHSLSRAARCGGAMPSACSTRNALVTYLSRRPSVDKFDSKL
eukprot:6190663-Pleurochrysis_carterae.AAC.3